ncbi:hypothetical protein NPX13_g3206 [Xylaria arbuscula]|uniref:Beta-glucuronidase C-terminal domain-containing protein n=1 Tax=Xylaria arbuscula TaxID=114810 RepID=A0A9W8TPK7_9PEZI|nr:hypothetical protein NPX13_g3206 [Xylaria arbuscula]
MFSEGTRPVSAFEVATPWAEGAEVKVVRLTAPGTNAKSNVTVAGTVFDDGTGEAVVGGDGTVQLGDEYSEVIQVGAKGVLKLDIRRAEGVLLEKSVSCAAGGDSDGDGEGDDEQNGSTPGTSGTSRVELERIKPVSGEYLREAAQLLHNTQQQNLIHLSHDHHQHNNFNKHPIITPIFHLIRSTFTMPFLGSDAPSSSDPITDSSVSQQAQTGDSSSTATGAGVNTGAGTTREKTEAEIEADRLYEEAIEEEYAKRDGGA